MNNDPDVPNIEKQDSEMDLEEEEQEPAQELIVEKPEGNHEPPPAADAVPQEINQDFHHVAQEIAEPEAERGEMQPGDYIHERPVRKRHPPSTLNYGTLGNPCVSSLQASNDSAFNPSTTVCHPKTCLKNLPTHFLCKVWGFQIHILVNS